jgi:membrane-associated protein
MDALRELFHLLTDPRALLAAFGAFSYVGIFAVIFAETGLFLGFFLPGDSLLFAAGLFAAPGTSGTRLDLPILIAICVAAAIAGNLVGFAFGRRVGRRLFARPDSRLFKRKHLLAAETYYNRHGGKTIVIARFLPFVRTFAPIVAGIGHMDVVKFTLYTVIGGALWGAGVPIAGYLLGERIPDIDRYLLPIIIVIILISIIPPAAAVIRERRKSQRDPRLPIVPVPAPPSDVTED